MTHDLKPRTKQHAIFWAWEDVIDGWDVVFHSMMQTNNKSYRVKVLGLDEQGNLRVNNVSCTRHTSLSTSFASLPLFVAIGSTIIG